MRILLLVLAVLAAVTWLSLRWVRVGGSTDSKAEAADYASLLNRYAMRSLRRFREARDADLSWEERMKWLYLAEEAKHKHTQALLDAPTDMRDQIFDYPPSTAIRSLRQKLFEARKGTPDLPWRVLQEQEKIDHARVLERAAFQLRIYGEVSQAEEVEGKAQAIYRDLINGGTKISVPYKRLATLCRRQNELGQEVEVLERGLEQISFESEKERQKLQVRLKQIRQLRKE